MKKFVSLAVNDNHKYMYFIPLVSWAWQRLGWDCILFYTGPETKLYELLKTFQVTIRRLSFVNGIKYDSSTVSQVSRFYVGKLSFLESDDIVMTSDADMLPLSNYWFNDSSTYCYGRNLSDEHQPVCYVSATVEVWADMMNAGFGYIIEELIKRDLDEYAPKAKNIWCVDQDMLTDKLKGVPKINIDRPIDKRTGYPLGRVDRSNWRLDHDQLIDCHMPHDILTNDKSFHKVMELLHLNWPKEDFKWFVEYHRNFKKLM
jgi:hypothetical protein